MSKLPAVTISGDALSDLFFQHEKPEYDAVDRIKGDYAVEETVALLVEAKAFATMIGEPDLAPELVEDFNERL